MEDKVNRDIMEEALVVHASGRPGKIEIAATKPLTTQHDLSLLYSPGVAEPCLQIARDESLAYDYTAKGNFVAVISNGTAVLGLGNLGALGSKPVMEGKGVLFKRFADVDGIDIEVDTENVDEFVNCVRFLGKTWGGINLEDIKAPECFAIEKRLREVMDIPVFHDDQHGTAIISTAGLINAVEITGRKMEDVQIVVNGAGASAISCTSLFKMCGVRDENVIMCDSKGVIYKGRTEGMNEWKEIHAVDTNTRTLEEAMVGADIAVGLSVKGAFTQDMIKTMADQPIIFAMANPDPEITPEDALAVSPDAIMATGRSDYPNQVNNVLGFPYIFRGALDVRASTINDEMKLAAAQALADLAREDVPDEVSAAYGSELRYGPGYIIPAPFDPRLIEWVPAAVAQAAMDSGVARKPIVDMDAYRTELRSRLDPTMASLHMIFENVRANPRRVVFAEGEEEKSIRAAVAFKNAGYGTPILIGREERVKEAMERIGINADVDIETHNARISSDNKAYTDFLYKKLQRRGALYRDCQRMVNLDRNVFGACMVANGDADAMVTGLTRNYYAALQYIRRVLDPKEGERVMGLTILLTRSRTLFLADTAVNELPSSEEMADFAIQAAAAARRYGHEPRVALISFSNFGNPDIERSHIVRDAVAVLDKRKVNFEYDGEMGLDVALNPELMKQYPFCRLSGPANVLIMPGLHSAHASTRLVNELGAGTVIGPLLIGLEKPAQILNAGATVNDMVNMAAFAAHEAHD
ncbi:MAG: NADP-dependent malic enzyme [Rhodospirillales bacterium]|jgi:malate dehydrogenase (oxaloacetate-decarboxylating)(NADP+)|nr:NADP-dependent malic enzyme [Rhodospirillales bacterium]